MKIVSWNCNQAFRNKKDEIIELDPDIVVVQESEDPENRGDWREFSDFAWIGKDRNLGLAVFTRNCLEIESYVEDYTKSEYALPIKLNNGLKILGIWAKNDKENQQNRYISQVYRALKNYQDWIDENTVIIGDFNWNPNFSKDYPLKGDFQETIELLRKLNMSSAYHLSTGEDFGSEDKSTFHMYRKEDRKYHIDYAFLSDDKHEIKQFKVGNFNKWIKLSDHRPIILELDK